jgi:hypothetical protein
MEKDYSMLHPKKFTLRKHNILMSAITCDAVKAGYGPSQRPDPAISSEPPLGQPAQQVGSPADQEPGLSQSDSAGMNYVILSNSYSPGEGASYVTPCAQINVYMLAMANDSWKTIKPGFATRRVSVSQRANHGSVDYYLRQVS